MTARQDIGSSGASGGAAGGRDAAHAPGPDAAELAAAGWRTMRALVLDNERRREVCHALGLSFVRVKALMQLAQAPLPMTELAAALSTDAPYTTLVVDDLEGRGLVERRAHPVDRRAKVVVATRRGGQLAARARAILETPPAELAGLPPADLSTLVRILGDLTP